MKHIVLLNSDKPEPIEILAARTDLQVSVITKPKYAHLYTWAARVLEVSDIANVQEAAEAALAAARIQPIDAVVCPFERALLPGGFIRSNLALPGLSYDQSTGFANKLTMKQRLREKGLPTADYRRVDCVEELSGCSGELGWPLIIKPAIGSGSYNTTVIKSERDFLHKLAAGDLMDLSKSNVPLIAESYLSVHAEYHCDGVIYGGKVQFAAVSKYVAPVLPSLGQFIGSYILPQLSQAAMDIETLHMQAVQALGLEQGVTHLEVYATEKGYIIGEITCRPAGGGIPMNVEKHTGVSIWRAFIQTSLGEMPELNRHYCSGISGWLGLPVSNGLILNLSSEEELAGIPGVREVQLAAAPGQMINERQTSVLYAGKVFFQSGDELQAEEILSKIKLAYHYEQVPRGEIL
ncbi:hypothetical protein [Paenibacillus sp. S150]|uniref:hypothetical protein n=1 Tax=Paenibacillus sp. S150 TaxID=2749826 RepID=UPI001C56B4CC|nr:hypothetical protein [Paenibacillus sp. S150]MBW4082414.1 hypothetical protein [Paenibacillus sp. S150]